MYEVKTRAFNCLGNGNKGNSLTDKFLRQQYVYMSGSLKTAAAKGTRSVDHEMEEGQG